MRTSGVTIPLIALLAAAPCMPQSMFRGDAAHSGVYPGSGPQKFHRVKWKFPTGERVISSPVWDNGVVYFGSDDHNLYAVDAATGRQTWKFSTQGPVPATPAIAGGTVYFGSYDGKFYAVDARNGKLRWKFSTGGERRFEAKGIHGLQPKNQTIPDPWDVYFTQRRASFDGSSKPAMLYMPRLHFPAAPCTSGVGTRFSTRWTPRPEEKSGDSRAATIH